MFVFVLFVYLLYMYQNPSRVCLQQNIQDKARSAKNKNQKTKQLKQQTKDYINIWERFF